jgi:hypothetical protein
VPYPNEHAARIIEPDKFEPDSFRRKNITKGIDIIIGKLKGGDGKMETQAYRFDKNEFTADEAKKWLKDHDITYISFEPASEGKALYCRTLDKIFRTKKELFKELKLNEDKIISLKKAKEYKSAEKGQISISGAYLKTDIANKAGLDTKVGFVYPVINTTRYMDDQDDVHLDGLWKKTLQEQTGKIFYLAEHSKKIDDVIAWPEDVKVFTQLIDWSFVGKDYQGQTEALIFEIDESKLKKQSALEAIKERRKVQGSVSMFYVKVNMAIDSTDKEYSVNKAYFDSKIDLIANKDKALEQGYFFGVEEAKIGKEGSMVLFGANDATEIIYSKNENETEPVVCEACKHEFDYLSIPEAGMGYVECPKCKKPVTQNMLKNEPLDGTHNTSEPLKNTQEPVDYKYLLTHLKN